MTTPEATSKANLGKRARDTALAIDKLNGESEDNLIRLSTGVILCAKQANPTILIQVMTATPRPQPPMYHNKAMGREMENPDDPDYISRVKAWEMEYNANLLNVLVGLGTEFVEAPKGFPKFTEDGWIADYRSLTRLPVMPESKAWRYITWVFFKAAPLPEDMKLIGDKVKALSGVPEADVQNAETFRGGDKVER